MEEHVATDWQTHDLVLLWQLEDESECVMRDLYLIEQWELEDVILIPLD